MASLEEKRNYIKLVRDRYRKGRKSKKGVDIWMRSVSYLCCDRKHAIKLLSANKAGRPSESRKEGSTQ
jgi:hypothetical protein